ncbi:MAG: threonine/serine exporter family protein [Chthoniobacterales bacterium]
MTPCLSHLLHQALFGGIAAAGFGILFNCPPRIIGLCFGAGALALAMRTAGLDAWGLNLPMSSFFAALLLAVADRSWQEAQSLRSSVVAVVGCIPMVPGSLVAVGLKNLFMLLKATPGEGVLPATAAVESFVIVTCTLAAIGTALAIPSLAFPAKRRLE